MSSHQEIIDALTAFYKQVTKHLSLDEVALKEAPAQGWNIDAAALQYGGKTEAVLKLLQHIPYLEVAEGGDSPAIWDDTVPIDYRTKKRSFMDDVNRLPEHCVYLTEGIFQDGFSLIVDTEKGTITEYSILDRNVTADPDDFEMMPDSEKWRGHRTLPAAELLGLWTSMFARLVKMLVPNISSTPRTGIVRTRVPIRNEAEMQAKDTDELEECHPSEEELQESTRRTKNESLRQLQMDQRRHIADVYNSFLRHGWNKDFDKEACRVEVTKLEEQNFAKEMAHADPQGS
ncbi:unnamed protein product [Zymoseptoria tritici ST99CH_3D7]|uniref:Uncharacterized protein n=2 Tax=Zymoseptoria tritici TaxID=1047171 RepID=F9XEU2_ZYMTI|nr:uncharacterized protein MYCGRDRAFT_94726 [Zymoseptoria tritici IPO323]EGP85830.1 hypothetical protein MYCGRDRAFT_94726 [Zymoseptoria tritici IPO323]SMQ52816.1 unnamed protein product [Zymoseptoria tritici ST99CH_3D7]